jgi:tetratricopeptide (TPR) repeat protein
LKSLFLIILFFSFAPRAQSSVFEKATSLYSQGKYQATIEELSRVEKDLTNDSKSSGLVSYWKGMTFNRLQDFPSAEIEFRKSIKYNYVPKDLFYELGQALFASEKLIDAKIYFNESFKRSFKRGTSLYYMAFISLELSERDNARTLFSDLVRLTDPDALESRQAAQMYLADMELEEAEVERDVFRRVETEVIPMYEKAAKFNPTSPLAPRIDEKIKSLQKKYKLVLFQLRNGRPTLIPPYFLRAAQELGVDTNVTFAPAETQISKSLQSSLFSKTDFHGKYTFYFKNFFSYAPELRFNNMYYLNRVPEIYRNDNYLVAPALRMAHEHSLWDNPATFLIDYEYSQAQRAINEKGKLEFSSRTHAYTIGEKFKFWSFGETVLRLKRRTFESFLSANHSYATGLVMEQVVGLKNSTLLFYSSLDFTRVNTNLFDTNALMIRSDWLLPKFKDWFNPSVGMALTVTDPINDREGRGIETLMNPNIRLNRSLGKNWKLNSRLEYHKNNSKNKTSFDYQKNLFGLELEYVY